MAYRRKIPKKRSKRLFRKTAGAGSVKGKNFPRTMRRGGIRL